MRASVSYLRTRWQSSASREPVIYCVGVDADVQCGSRRRFHMLNRRQFLTAGAAFLGAGYALPTDKMRFAMSGHEFVTTPPHPEAGFTMTARYGYHGIGPFQEDVAKYVDQPPEKLKEKLDEAGIALCTVGSGGQYLDPAKLPATIENNAARARYVSYFGCKHLKVNLSRRVGDGTANLSS